MLKLTDSTPFSSGGNRLCYRHPHNPDRCLKVLRPDRTPAIRRNEKSFPAKLRPLEYFDENLVEFKALNHLHTYYPDAIRKHLPETFGLISTDKGLAHMTSLILDHDGLISQTLEQYVWEHGLNSIAAQSISKFKLSWQTRTPHTRDLIPHNFVLQHTDDTARLVLIDGFGRKPSTVASLFRYFSKRRIYKRRILDLDQRIERLLERKSNRNGPDERLNNLIR